MRALITGGAGFIGSHLLDQLNKLNIFCTVIDDLSKGKKSNIRNIKQNFIKQNIQSSQLSSIIKKVNPDLVFHLAAQTNLTKSIIEPKKDININFFGTLNLLESLEKAPIKKLIFASSSAVYGDNKKVPIFESFPTNPFSMYGISKLSSEIMIANWAKEKSMSYVNLRFANVYGEKQDSTAEGGVVSIFINKLLKSEPLNIYGDGEQTRDFIYVGDVASAIVKILNENVSGTFNVGTSKETGVNQLTRIIERIAEKKAEKIYKKRDFAEVKRSTLSYQEIFKATGWKPQTSLGEGLKKTYEYFRQN